MMLVLVSETNLYVLVLGSSLGFMVLVSKGSTLCIERCK